MLTTTDAYDIHAYILFLTLIAVDVSSHFLLMVKWCRDQENGVRPLIIKVVW